MTSKTRHLFTGAAILWMGVIFAFSSLPGSSVPEGPPALGHFFLYAVLGMLLYLALPRDKRIRTLLIAASLASLYGVTDEFHQSFVPGRTPDILDWLVDTCAATLAASLTQVCVLHQSQRNSERSTNTE